MQSLKLFAMLTCLVSAALVSAATAQQRGRISGYESYQDDRGERAGVDERPTVRRGRYNGGIVDGIYGRYFPFETDYAGYDTPFDDSDPPRGYRGPFAADYGYRFDGDNYGYGGYDFGHGDLGYRESLGLEPVYTRERRPILRNQ